MTFKGIMTAIAATALVASPTMAVAAQPAPVAQPATEKADGDNALRSGSWVVAFIALAAIIAGIVNIAYNDYKPNSP